MNRTFALLGAVYGLLGVGLGAWGAHGLQSYVGHSDTGAWETAVLYQLVHAPVLLIIGLWHQRLPQTILSIAGWAIALGVLLFSGSLYLLILDGPTWLGPITPIGGTALVVGWVCLVWGAAAPHE